VQYRGLVGVSGLNLGVAVKNIGPQMQYEGSGLYRDALARDGNRPTQITPSSRPTPRRGCSAQVSGMGKFAIIRAFPFFTQRNRQVT